MSLECVPLATIKPLLGLSEGGLQKGLENLG